MTVTGEIKNVCGVMDVCFELVAFLREYNVGKVQWRQITGNKSAYVKEHQAFTLDAPCRKEKQLL